MLDLQFIRDNPILFDGHMERRGLDKQSATILALDEKRRRLQTQIQKMQAFRNSASKRIAQLRSAGKEQKAKDLARDVSLMKEKLIALNIEERDLKEALYRNLYALPNILDHDVAPGVDESSNVLVRAVGKVPEYSFSPKQHWQLGESLGMMDFSYAAKISGSRFVNLGGDLALLARALANFMIDMHVYDHGYTEYQVPLLVRAKGLLHTGQLPKYEDDLFKTTKGHYLISTGEVPLTNFAYDTIFSESDLPMRLTALTPCFRREAGAAGKDTRGMVRQHQFYKVELVSFVIPEQSAAEHHRMTSCAENVVKSLNIPYRVIALCAGDTGFSSRKTFDIEVWLPGQNAYREVSSCSNCGDFQARRMQGRVRKKGRKDTTFIHTLNGSGLAVGRMLIAILENNQRKDGSIVVPEPLRPYMGHIECIRPQ